MRLSPIVALLFVIACAKEQGTTAVTLGSTEAPSASASASPQASSISPSASTTTATSATPAAPSATVAGTMNLGPAGPKGDGTCVARGYAGCTSPPCSKVERPVPCPAIPTTKSTDDELGGAACDWAQACDRMGDEGCCVGCKNPFRVKLSRACALQIVAKKDCKSVQSTWDSCAGR